MTAVGHEDAFPRPRLRGRCRFSQRTFTRTRSNERDAPKADHLHARDRLARAPADAEAFRPNPRRLSCNWELTVYEPSPELYQPWWEPPQSP